MELGATICSPLNPSCSMCPVSGHCNALSISKLHEKVLVTDYPLKVIKAKQRHEFSAVCVVELINGQDNISEGFLLVKRPHKGLLAGMWEFPSVVLNKESEASTRREAIDHLLKKSFKLHPGPACNVVTRENVGEYVHVFSHIRLKMYIELMLIQLKGMLTCNLSSMFSLPCQPALSVYVNRSITVAPVLNSSELIPSSYYFYVENLFGINFHIPEKYLSSDPDRSRSIILTYDVMLRLM